MGRPHVADQAWRAGPWCWPRDERRAAGLAARVGPVPGPRAGVLPGVTLRDDCVMLWQIASGIPGRGVTIGPRMRASWRDAALALPRALPLLWRDVHDAIARLPSVTYLASVRTSEGMVDPDHIVDGPSFGLAFCLLQASTVLDCPIAPDVIAMAAVDAAGRVEGVGGLGGKIAGVRRMAPRVTRLLVAAEQAEECRSLAGDDLQVVPVGNAAEAIAVAFGDALEARLLDAARDVQSRDDLTRSFFRLALTGSDAIVEWRPVMRAAARALEAWSDLDPDARYRLAFAGAVAARHHDNSGRAPLPPGGWLDRLPRPLRTPVLAHLVQQAADVGSPDPLVVLRLVAPWLDHPVGESAVPDLRLRGAVARLQAVTGRARLALETQERLARACADAYADDDVAYPLAEWARLAGALEDVAALGRATDFHDRMLGLTEYRGLGPRFVEMALIRGRLLLRPDDEEALTAAAHCAADLSLPDHLRWSAHRWAGHAFHDALAAAAVEGHPMAMRYHSLTQLDRAVAVGDAENAQVLVDALEALDPGPVGHLKRSGASPRDVARLYPY